MKKIKILMWLPLDEPIPAGWRRAKCRPSHHDRWSILIEKIADE